MISTRVLVTTISLSLLANTPLLADGGASQTGVLKTGMGWPQIKKATEVAIEEENFTIAQRQMRALCAIFAALPLVGHVRKDKLRRH